MSKDRKKYRITEKEGADIFLEAIRSTPQSKPETEAQEEASFKKKFSRKLLIIGSPIILFIIIMSVVAYNLVMEFRSENIEINTVISNVERYESILKKGHGLEKNFEESMHYADSLLGAIDSLIDEYPDKDTLKTLWSDVLVHKYERYINYMLKSAKYDNIAGLDSTQVQKARNYNPSFASLIDIMSTLPEFYQYKQLYPEPPILASNVPQQWDIDNLIEKSERILDFLKTDAVAIEVDFPVLYTWIKYISNTIFPELEEWKKFWDKYRKAVLNENEIINSGLLDDLRQEYPDLQILNFGNDDNLEAFTGFSIGISKETLLPCHSNLLREWKTLEDFFRKKFDIEVNVKYFETSLQLENELDKDIIDIAVLDLKASTKAYFARGGIPIAMRAWNRKKYPAAYLIGLGVENEPGKSDKICSPVTDYYDLLSYLQSKNDNISTIVNQIALTNSVDSLSKVLNSGEIKYSVLCEEALYYLQSCNSLKKPINIIKTLGNTPMGVLWAREGLPAQSIRKIQNIMIPLIPADVYNYGVPIRDHPFADWTLYDPAIMEKFFGNARDIFLKYNPDINRIHMLPPEVPNKNISSPLKDALTEFLEKEGFAVIHSSSGNKLSQGDQFLTLSAKENSNDEIEYTIKVHHEKGEKDSLLYHDHFTGQKKDFPPDFEHKLFEMPAYLKVIGKVVKVEGKRIIVKTDVATRVLKGNYAYIIHEKDIHNRNRKAIGEGKIIETGKSNLIIKIDKNSSDIHVGDYCEIRRK